MLASPLANLRATFFARDRLVAGRSAPVHGVVLDVPMGHGLDTLAAYANGSARYINHSGKAVLWDRKADDNPIKPLIDRLLESALPLVAAGQPLPWGSSIEADEEGRATVLTAYGLTTRALGQDPIAAQLVKNGAAVIQELVRRTSRPENGA